MPPYQRDRQTHTNTETHTYSDREREGERRAHTHVFSGVTFVYVLWILLLEDTNVA